LGGDLSLKRIVKFLFSNKFGEIDLAKSPAKIILRSQEKLGKIEFFRKTASLFLNIDNREWQENGADIFREIAEQLIREIQRIGTSSNSDVKTIKEIVDYHERIKYIYPEIIDI
jgi:hypothetical protein